MRPYQDVDLPRLDSFERLLLFARRPKSADHVDRRQEARKSLAERLIVLLSQDRRRHQHRRLLAVHRRLVRRADRQLRFAEAHVAAYQSIHRLGALHVRLDLLDRAQLILRLLERKRLLKIFLSRIVRRKFKARRTLPPSIYLYQFVRYVLDRRRHARFRLRPLRRVQFVEPRRRILIRYVLLKKLHLIRRHEKFIRPRVLNM